MKYNRLVALASASLVLLVIFFVSTSSPPPADFIVVRPSSSSSPSSASSNEGDIKGTTSSVIHINNDGEQEQNTKNINDNNNHEIKQRSSSKLALLSNSGGVSWQELGNTGWKKPIRLESESLLTCSQARGHIDGIYDEAVKNLNFRAGPKFGMPWFFHSPYPICGSILLRHQHGSLDTVPVLRISNANNQRKTDSLISSSGQQYYDSILLSPSFKTADREFQDIFGKLDPKTEALDVVTGEQNPLHSVFIEECGDGHDYSQVLFTARLVSYNTIVNAKVIATRHQKSDEENEQSSSGKNNNNKIIKFQILFTTPLPGSYVLEVKTVHANGTSDNPRVPRSLGVVGIRANVGGRKAFMYNDRCDYQRHIIGSPILVRSHSSSPSSSSKTKSQLSTIITTTKLCKNVDHDFGYWMRITKPELCHLHSNPYCSGDPNWVSDASAYNTQYVWVPTSSATSIVPDCKFYYWSPPQGPSKSCLRFGDSRAFLYLVGDSVMREYAKNCDLISLRSSKLQCLFANIALEGQHFSNSYAESVAKTIVTNVRENNAGVFATNLGLQHMIGPCTTKQWRIFIRYFVLFWKQQIVWQKGTPQQKQEQELGGKVSSSSSTSNDDPELAALKIGSNSSSSTSSENTNNEQEKLRKFYFAPKYLRTKGEYPKLEQAVWIGPPTIQYARKGMGAERAALWDEIAWKELEPLGFKRMKTIPVTAARQEGTWDGLHYASEKGKVQTAWKNKNAKVYKWNGGVANVLFTMLLNLVCNR